MPEYAAEDLSFINARLKEIEAEKAAQRAKLDEDAPKPVPTDGGPTDGGFRTPSGEAYFDYGCCSASAWVDIGHG